MDSENENTDAIRFNQFHHLQMLVEFPNAAYTSIYAWKDSGRKATLKKSVYSTSYLHTKKNDTKATQICSYFVTHQS